MTIETVWRRCAGPCRRLGCSARIRRAPRWNTIVLSFPCCFCGFGALVGCDPVVDTIVYQARSETGTVVSIETFRCGTHDKRRGDVGTPTFVVAQADGTMITLRPMWPPSPACYEVILTSPDGRESRLPLTEIYRKYEYPPPSVYRGTLLPTSQPASGLATTQPAAE